MSEGTNPLPPDWVQQKLETLRRQLEASGSWPAGGDRLADDMAAATQALNSEELEYMFSIVLDDALSGVDITQRYPDFYRQMLGNETLHRLFIDSLDILLADQEPAAEPLPFTPGRDLSFLRQTESHPQVSQPRPGQWRVQWQKSVEQLQHFFAPGRVAPALRSDYDLWDEDNGWHTLLRSEVNIAHIQLDLLLEMQQPHSQADSVPLALTVTRLHPQDPWPALTATLHWGSYQQTFPLPTEGYTQLPSIPLDTIWQPADQTLRTGLHLTLDIHPA